MTISASISVGVIIAREEIDHPWQDHVWRLVSILPGAPIISKWQEVAQGDGWVQYHAATLPLELFRKETSAYLYNLGNREPVIYVVMREAEEDDAPNPVDVHLVTASPFEAQDYLDTGEDLVDSVDMPEDILKWIKGFVEEHHEEEEFYKRRQVKENLKEHKFGQEPILELRKRMQNGSAGNG